MNQEQLIKEAARSLSKGIFTSTNAAADFETGFEEGVEWQTKRDQWICFDTMTPEENKQFNEYPSELIMCQFDNGSVLRYDEDHPFAALTHVFFLPKNNQ